MLHQHRVVVGRVLVNVIVVDLREISGIRHWVEIAEAAVIALDNLERAAEDSILRKSPNDLVGDY
jgi:hypothetical protein